MGNSHVLCMFDDRSDGGSCHDINSRYMYWRASKKAYRIAFSRLKIFAVFVGYGDTTKNLSREIFTHAIRFMGVAICPCARTRRPSIAYRVYASSHRL